MYERRSVSRRRFESLVRRALKDLPAEFAGRLENIDIVVRARANDDQLHAGKTQPRQTLLGLYVGTDLTRRGYGYNFALPDRIFIFQQPLERIARDEEHLTELVRHTVLHELAHHFGIDDDRLHEIGRY
ncbi:MAG TPA: metallopeptidase family protein [Dehalococcoidia bacterium]|jgi:predicted Zn-dependent protease with MMP-like domain